MKIVWVSPYGNGWSIAQRMRDGGNKVVLYTPNKNGSGYLPTIPWSRVEGFVNQADLVICDGNFPSRPTRRSWEASDQVMLLNALVKKRGVPYVGPTPTSELIENDPRYMRKILQRTNVPSIKDGAVSQGIILSLDPDGRLFVVLRDRSEALNLRDLIVTPPTMAELPKKIVQDLAGFLRSIGYNGYINMELVIEPDGPKVTKLTTSFLYPGIFAQWLAPRDIAVPLVAITIRNDHPNVQQPGRIQQMSQLPSFFGAEIHRDGDNAVLHGEIAGAGVEQQLNLDPAILVNLKGFGLL